MQEFAISSSKSLQLVRVACPVINLSLHPNKTRGSWQLRWLLCSSASCSTLFRSPDALTMMAHLVTRDRAWRTRLVPSAPVQPALASLTTLATLAARSNRHSPPRAPLTTLAARTRHLSFTVGGTRHLSFTVGGPQRGHSHLPNCFAKAKAGRGLARP